MASLNDYRQMIAARDLASVWPQWRIVRPLGAGSFGEVYEIQREEYGRLFRCALKILRKEEPMSVKAAGMISQGNASEEFIRTVLKEIDIMEKLKGAPNIVVIEDYAVVRNNDSCSVLIRMELLRNLDEFMMSGQITIADIIRIGTDVCNALDYCEEQNIIHRDVKESNIFYSDMGMFKLGDFGISRQLSGYLMNNATMTSIGTVSRMAPEVYKGEKYDSRVDIYSLGVVLYSLLNYGRPPFYPPYPEEVPMEAAYEADMKRIKGFALPPLTTVDDKLNRIVCKACSPKPSARYRTAAEFREALLEYYDKIIRRETVPMKKGSPGLHREKEPDPAVQQLIIQQPTALETVTARNLAGGGMSDTYFVPQEGSEEGGGSNFMPVLVLIASIAIIFGSLVFWYTGQLRKGGTGSRSTPNYLAGNTEQMAVETEEIPEGTEENDPAAGMTADPVVPDGSGGSPAGSDALFGWVQDRFTGDWIENVTLTFYEGESAAGDPVLTVTTDSEGRFNAALGSGQYYVVITKEGYEDIEENISVGVYSSDAGHSIYMSPTDIEVLRLVLEWDEGSCDLDSYLRGNGQLLNPWNQEISSDGQTAAVMEKESRSAPGVEMITIYDMEGSYEFFVFDYNLTGTMQDSGATVTIYAPGEPSQTVSIPSDEGNTWYVCRIEEGSVTVTNYLEEESSSYAPKE